MNRAQTLKVLGQFLHDHDARCPDPHLATIHEDREPEHELTEMSCRTCGVRVTRTRAGDDWNATWQWPGRDPELHHPGGCPREPRAHTHDERGDIQLSLVP